MFLEQYIIILVNSSLKMIFLQLNIIIIEFIINIPLAYQYYDIPFI
jgi:hypothetical protein